MPHHKRPLLLIAIGAAIAVVGVMVFLAAHAIATPGPGVLYSANERDLHEILWAAFGMALWLGGIMIGVVGSWAWCRNGA